MCCCVLAAARRQPANTGKPSRSPTQRWDLITRTWPARGTRWIAPRGPDEFFCGGFLQSACLQSKRPVLGVDRPLSCQPRCVMKKLKIVLGVVGALAVLVTAIGFLLPSQIRV